uniref:EMILIN-3-like n=1 Tax=Myxine glutinosa TaxID=7769 RepID=UPI00358E3162
MRQSSFILVALWVHDVLAKSWYGVPHRIPPGTPHGVPLFTWGSAPAFRQSTLPWSASRNKNWCASMVSQTVTCVVLNGTVIHVTAQHSPCARRLCPLIYRLTHRPCYRIGYKKVSKLQWRCCPGFRGAQCKDGSPGGAMSSPLRPVPGQDVDTAGPALPQPQGDRMARLEAEVHRLSAALARLQPPTGQAIHQGVSIPPVLQGLTGEVAGLKVELQNDRDRLDELQTEIISQSRRLNVLRAAGSTCSCTSALLPVRQRMNESLTALHVELTELHQDLGSMKLQAENGGCCDLITGLAARIESLDSRLHGVVDSQRKLRARLDGQAPRLSLSGEARNEALGTPDNRPGVSPQGARFESRLYALEEQLIGAFAELGHGGVRLPPAGVSQAIRGGTVAIPQDSALRAALQGVERRLEKVELGCGLRGCGSELDGLRTDLAKCLEMMRKTVIRVDRNELALQMLNTMRARHSIGDVGELQGELTILKVNFHTLNRSLEGLREEVLRDEAGLFEFSESLLRLEGATGGHRGGSRSISRRRRANQRIVPAFSVGLANTSAESGRLHFDTMLLNDGQHYHPKTGFFVVPIDGRYLISASIATKLGADTTATLYVSSRSIGRLLADGDTAGPASLTLLLALHAGDLVHVESTGEQALCGDPPHTTFSGFLVSAD